MLWSFDIFFLSHILLYLESKNFGKGSILLHTILCRIDRMQIISYYFICCQMNSKMGEQLKNVLWLNLGFLQQRWNTIFVCLEELGFILLAWRDDLFCLAKCQRWPCSFGQVHCLHLVDWMRKPTFGMHGKVRGTRWHDASAATRMLSRIFNGPWMALQSSAVDLIRQQG